MHLFGPVLRYDLVCTARRARYFVMRFFYALLLFLALYVFYITRLKGVTAEKVAQKLLIDFAELFSYVYLLIQYLLVVIMTPAYVGSAIAEEKERRTLEYLLTTDLRSQEIIFGKLASRVGNLLMFLLAGLPVLAFVLFYGGVDPELLKNGFLATLMTVFSISAVSLVCSVHARHSRDGIIRAYLVVVGYFIFCVIAGWLVLVLQGAVFGSGGNWTIEKSDPVVKGLCYFVEYLLTGNVIHSIWLYIASTSAPWLGVTSWTGVDLGTSMNALLRNYLYFHGSLTLVCLLYSVWRLRPLFLKQVFGESRRKKSIKQLADVAPMKATEKNATRPARGWRWKLADWPPMLWKELLVPRLSRRGLWARILTGVMWAAYLLPIGILFIFTSNMHSINRDRLSEAMHVYAMIAGTVCLCLMLVAVGIRAASAICQEKDKQTLETLLSTQLTDYQIIVGKWLGAALGYGPSLILLLIIWTICLVTGGLSIMSIGLLFIALLIYSGFASALGLFFSAGASTTTRSLMGTLFWLLIWMGGHWIFVGLVLLFTSTGERGIMDMLIGMTPPLVFVTFTKSVAIGAHDQVFGQSEYLRFAWIGLAINVLLTLLLLALSRQRFYLNTGRIHNLDQRPEISSAVSSSPQAS